MKEVGLIIRKMAQFCEENVKPFLFDKLEFEVWYPFKLERRFTKLCIVPHPKSACLNFLCYFVVPYALALIPFVYILRCTL